MGWFLSAPPQSPRPTSDFGMAREIDEKLYEQHTKQEFGPIRWMAPEQMDKHTYSKASDVYAFGVVLYEIWAREMPWRGVKNTKVAVNVSAGKQMRLPDSAPDIVRRLMTECWNKQPSKRPAMQDVQKQLCDEMEDTDTE